MPMSVRREDEVKKTVMLPCESFELRRLAETDLAELVKLEKRVYVQPWTVDNFLGELNRRITVPLSIKNGGLPVAYCFFWLMTPEVHLLNIAVSPEYRRCGFARRLLETMIDIGRRAEGKNVYLEVRPSNIEAVTLYESLGFFAAGRRPNYYEDGEDALLMTLDL